MVDPLAGFDYVSEANKSPNIKLLEVYQSHDINNKI